MLLTKLHIPPASQNIVHRPGLYEKLNMGLTRKLILVSAPAGFGKTTLLSDWINQQKIPTAWFSLDSGDNDPVEFLSYIISGIQGIHKTFGQGALNLLNSPNRPSDESIASLLINEILKINKNFLLVLDDFHLIKNTEVLRLVTYLLEHIPANIHIVIITRSDPSFSISRLRSQHQMVELRSSDLSFSANDISVLFNKKLKLGLSVEDIYSLEFKTEGWIAGLQLTALSMQGREDISEFIHALKGDNRYIMDYLMEEVLKVQSDDIKEFLLQTSILEQMSAPLCDAVLNRNDGRLILEKLDKNNMFVIPLDDERNWYRYHHLFADLLKQRLQLREKAIINELHNKACDWFEHNNMNELAINHTLETKNYEKCFRLLGKIAKDMWQNGMHTALLKYGDMLPGELIKTNPEFCLYYSWILISAGQIQKAEPFLASAELKTKNIIQGNNLTTDHVQYHKKLLGKISVAFAYLNSHEKHSEKIFDYCKTAMKNLSEDDPLWFSWAWFSYGVAYFSRGDFIKSNEAYNNAFEYGKKSGNLYLISTIAIRLAENEQMRGHYKSAYNKCSGLLALMQENGYSQLTKAEWTYAALYLIMGISQLAWADFDKAFENIKTAYDLSKHGKDIFLRTFVLMINAAILLEFENVDTDEKINELEELLEQNEIPPYLKSMHLGWKIHVCIRRNQLDLARKIALENGLELNKEKTFDNESAYASYARLLLMEGKLDEAELLISELYALVSACNMIEPMIELKNSYAVLYKMMGKSEKAVSCLMEAMEMASAENLLFYFIIDSDRIHDLLTEVFKIHATTKTNIPARFIEKLKSALERKNGYKKTNKETDISARELETLKLVAQDLSNQEIAAKLFVSLNTVKTHLKNIYSKLGVDNRTKAVAKANALGII